MVLLSLGSEALIAFLRLSERQGESPCGDRPAPALPFTALEMPGTDEAEKFSSFLQSPN